MTTSTCRPVHEKQVGIGLDAHVTVNLGVDVCVVQCDIGNATKKFFDMMHEPPFKLLLFCCACPELTPNMADISRYWNIWQVLLYAAYCTETRSSRYSLPLLPRCRARICGSRQRQRTLPLCALI